MKKLFLLWLFLLIPNLQAQILTKLFYSYEKAPLNYLSPPNTYLPYPKIILITKDPLAAEFGSILLESFLNSKIYTVSLLDGQKASSNIFELVSKAGFKSDQLSILVLEGNGFEINENISKQETTEGSTEATGETTQRTSYAATVVRTDAASQQKSKSVVLKEDKANTSVNLRVGLKGYNPKTKAVFYTKNFTVSQNFQADKVLARGMAFNELELQIKNEFLPLEQNHTFRFATDRKFNLQPPFPYLIDGNFTEAITLAQTSIHDLEEKIGASNGNGGKKKSGEVKKLEVGLARAYYNLSLIYLFTEDYDQSRSYLSKAQGLLKQDTLFDQLMKELPTIREERNGYHEFMAKLDPNYSRPMSAEAPKASEEPIDLKARMSKLKELFDAGLIDEKEYQEKRKEIISKL